jgi:hypothetical protein
MTNVGGPVNRDDTYDLIDYALAKLASDAAPGPATT